MVGFAIGLVLGGTLGYLTCAVLVVGVDADRAAQEIEREELDSHTFYVGGWNEQE